MHTRYAGTCVLPWEHASVQTHMQAPGMRILVLSKPYARLRYSLGGNRPSQTNIQGLGARTPVLRSSW